MECERCDGKDALRQGDVIAAQPGTASWHDPTRRFGIIISADCDIEQNKGGSSLVYLPIISHIDYINLIWIPQEANKTDVAARSYIDKLLRDVDPSLSSRHLFGWAKRSGLESLLDNLKSKALPILSEDKLTERLDLIVGTFSRIVELAELQDGTAPTERLDILKRINNFFDLKDVLEKPAKTGGTHRKSAIENALQALQTRIDTWLIKDLIGLDPDMLEQHVYGYVVPMRLFSRVETTEILKDKIEWYGDKDKYLRVCRIRGIYKSDLMQRFSNMFSRIGLEDQRDEEHRRLFSRSASAIIS